MKIKLLGTGTSSGVPLLGCSCEVCTSSDARDHRLRASALIEVDGVRLLIDCGPDFRYQMLKESFQPFDGVLLTHEHYDHVGGLDDLRPFCFFGSIPIYGEEDCLNHIASRMPYCFGPNKYPSAPSLELHTICANQPFQISSLEILPFRVMHGNMPIIGFRIKDFAYITDMKTLPETSENLLQGIRCLVINGLRFREHPTHQTVQEAVEWVNRLNVPEAYITHIAHSAGLHAASETILPENIRFGFDGQEIFLP